MTEDGRGTNPSARQDIADTIEYRVDEAIAIITLNRPDRLNAILPGMASLYAACLRRAEADPQVRAIVVTGAGRGFCSGADLAVLAEGAQALSGYLEDQDVDSLPTVALRIEKPVVTAINGPCAGIGFVLAIAADVRFAAPNATLSTSFSRLGLVAEYGVSWLLPRLVGLPAATEILLSGRTLTADEALRLGLVHEVADDVVEAAMSWARQAASACAPVSLREIKGQLLRSQTQDMDAAVAESLRLMERSFAWPELGEALQARAQKRPPVFGQVPAASDSRTSRT